MFKAENWIFDPGRLCLNVQFSEIEKDFRIFKKNVSLIETWHHQHQQLASFRPHPQQFHPKKLYSLTYNLRTITILALIMNIA